MRSRSPSAAHFSVPGSGAVSGSWRHRDRDQLQRLRTATNRAWPTPAGRLTRVTSLCRAGWLHLVERAKLALCGLRSAEPRLGKPWPPLGRAGEDRLGAAGGRRRSPSRLERRRAHLRERLGDRLRGRRALLDERREAGLEAVAVGVDRGPPVAEPLGVVASEVRAHVGALEQQRSL